MMLAHDIASPSTRPRSAAGLASESQAMPAVHEIADERPWPTRTAKRPANVETPASASVASESRATPKIVSRRAPTRGLQWPTTGEPKSTAPEYAPTAMPAWVFERCRSRAYWGSSGTIANMRSASRNTTQ